jgi:uncharacterized OsmC-like protein
MYGTLRRALVARGIEPDPQTYKATVEGLVEKTAKTFRISEIAIHYDLSIPTGKRAEANRALRVHPQVCPAHESIKDAIKVNWTATITET